MKRAVIASLALALLLAAAGCGGGSSSSSNNTTTSSGGGSGGGTSTGSSLPPTMHSGALTVGLDPPAVGFQVGTLRGSKVINPTGFEIDLAKAIARKLGIPAGHITWEKVPFDTLFRPGPKPFDFAFEEATITPQRQKVVDFTSSYFDANQGVLLNKDATAPKSLDRPEEDDALRPDGHDRPRLRPAPAEGDEGADLHHDLGRVQRRPGRPLQRVRDGRADRRVAEEVEALGLRRASPARSSRTSSTAACSRRTAS